LAAGGGYATPDDGVSVVGSCLEKRMNWGGI
jgi:hypothetical protein